MGSVGAAEGSYDSGLSAAAASAAFDSVELILPPL